VAVSAARPSRARRPVSARSARALLWASSFIGDPD